jgi:hypothetical protein
MVFIFAFALGSLRPIVKGGEQHHDSQDREASASSRPTVRDDLSSHDALDKPYDQHRAKRIREWPQP